MALASVCVGGRNYLHYGVCMRRMTTMTVVHGLIIGHFNYSRHGASSDRLAAKTGPPGLEHLKIIIHLCEMERMFSFGRCQGVFTVVVSSVSVCVCFEWFKSAYVFMMY